MAANSSMNGTEGSQEIGTELWRHPAPETTQMWDFLQKMNKEQGLEMKSYDDLYQWSIENIADFWAGVWDYVGIVASTPYKEVEQIPPTVISIRT